MGSELKEAESTIDQSRNPLALQTKASLYNDKDRQADVRTDCPALPGLFGKRHFLGHILSKKHTRGQSIQT